MADDYVEVTEGAGKKLRTSTKVVGANTVHQEWIIPVDSSGTEILPATEATQATVHGHVDSIDGKITECDTGAVVVASGDVTSNAQNIATQTTLAAINTKLVTGTDIGDVTINNAAGAAAVNIQDGGNVVTVDGTVTAIPPAVTAHDARIDTATATTNVEVVAAAGTIIYVVGYQLQAKGDVEVVLRSASTDISPEWDLNAREGAICAHIAQWNTTKTDRYFKTVTNEALNIYLDAAVRVTGNVQYVLGTGA
jgi:predicted amino acid dehydrogenase